jgi:serine protease Do
MPPSRFHRNGTRFAAPVTIILLLAAFAGVRADDSHLPNLPASSLRRTPVVDVVDKNKGVVVNIFSERMVSRDNQERQFELMQSQRVNGMGTGVIIDPRGYIITNHHVVDDVQTLRVHLNDGTSLSARVVAREPAEDLAIIKVDSPRPLPIASLGTATDLLVGETVVAIGNAFGYEHSVTAGVVSALKRDVTLNREISYKSLIQTDASINPGNSGGPLFNINGELVGINVAIRAGAQGIGFTIPIDTAMRVASDMLSVKRRIGLTHGLTVHDMLDVSGNPIRRWASIDRVEPNSPADKAGLKAGDVFDRSGELKVVCALDLERSFLDRAAGEKTAVVVRRGASNKGEGGEEIKADLILRPFEKAPAPLPADLVWKKLGIKVQPAAVDQVVKVNPQLHGGLLITEVSSETAAAKAGFQRGDILIGLHQWETINVDNIFYVLSHPDLAAFSPLRYIRIRSGQLQRGVFQKLD